MKIDILRKEIVGLNKFFDTPYGKRVTTYADYTASGRALKFIEKYLLEIQKFYANTHTEDDITGEVMTNLLHESEKIVKKELNASRNCYVIEAGSGATGAVLRLSEILGLYFAPATRERFKNLIDNSKLNSENKKNIYEELKKELHDNGPVVFIGPYEHHSNILMWRESIAEVVEIKLNKEGYLDLEDLEIKVKDEKYSNRAKIGSFSAASNVTGIKTDVYKVADILHENNGIACFDYAASAPYVKIDMNPETGSYLDAVFFSPHKFIGGPGACGILVINSKIYDNTIPPTTAGGGTVDYVSELGQDYYKNPEEREKAGTPGIIQAIKASLVIELKNKIGIEKIEELEYLYIKKFMDRFKDNKNLIILGPKDPDKRVSIISFMVEYKGKHLHPRFVTRLLNDLFGIQSRAGCACAGPYGHRLLGIDSKKSEIFRKIIQKDIHSLKPGWTRINLHYTMTEEEVEFLIDAVDFISNYGYLFLDEYEIDLKSGNWLHKNSIQQIDFIRNFGIESSFEYIGKSFKYEEEIDRSYEYKKYLDEAEIKARELKERFTGDFKKYKDDYYESLRWFDFINLVNEI
ncbi:MAG: aminotransferase class V-fold PLP-dependent enzyme [Bacillota bacterium]|nr:aminotransferase class V-fold PLP-dependent enzyme [Bacillota bacterium]